MKAYVPTVIPQLGKGATTPSTGGQRAGRTRSVRSPKVMLLAASLFPFNINADVFYAWTTQDLLPKLPAGSVVVMDNAAFHKREDIKSRIRAAGHILEFLPTYSPDLNPIEQLWAQLKHIRNKTRCSVDGLFSKSLFNIFYERLK
ncbi:MAG: transposase [Methylovulum sp.]|nr:transposase [Methylovulum sp.]